MHSERVARDAGYTLVEALTVLVVIGIMAGAVVLLAPGPDKKARDFVERFAARLSLASEETVLRNRPIGLFINDEGFGFSRLERAGWTPAEAGTPLAFRAWPEGIDHRVEETAIPDDGRRDGLAARFDSMGGATPARIALSGGGERWIVEIDGQGRARVSQAR